MANYSFIAENPKTKEQRIIGIKSTDTKTGNTIYKDGVSLAVIDKYTLKFDSEEQLVYYLEKNGIISNNENNLYIEYHQDGIKKIPVVYKKYSNLIHFANKSNTKVEENDYVFQEVLSHLLYNCSNDSNYFKYLVNNKYLDKYLEEHIQEYSGKNQGNKYERDDSIFLRKKISQHILFYKTLRGIIVGTQQYYEFNKDIECDKDNTEVDDTTSININYSSLSPDSKKKYDDMIAMYENGGYDELNSNYDLDDMVDAPIEVQKRLGLKLS